MAFTSTLSAFAEHSTSPASVVQKEVAVILAKMQNNTSNNGFYIPSPGGPKAHLQIEPRFNFDLTETASYHNLGLRSSPSPYQRDFQYSVPFQVRTSLYQKTPASFDWHYNQKMRSLMGVARPEFVSSGTAEEVVAPRQEYQQIIRSFNHNFTNHPASQTHEDMAPHRGSVSIHSSYSSRVSDNSQIELKSRAIKVSQPVNHTLYHPVQTIHAGVATSTEPTHQITSTQSEKSTSTHATPSMHCEATKPPETPATVRPQKRKRKLHTCETCQKEFSSRRALKEHGGVHKTGHFMCVYCGKKFNQRSTLQVHTRLHTGEQPYSCKFCDKKFSDNSSFVKHLRVHTREVPYKCHLCHRGFSQSGNMKRHISTVHRDVDTTVQKKSKLDLSHLLDVEN